MLKFDSKQTDKPCGTEKCNEKRCGTCRHMLETDNITISSKPFHIKENMDCKVTNVIYCLMCSGCGSEYIGQTKCLRNRVTLHNQQIRQPELRSLFVSQHIAECTEGMDLKYKVAALLKKESEQLRKMVEINLIRKFTPPLNRSTRH